MKRQLLFLMGLALVPVSGMAAVTETGGIVIIEAEDFDSQGETNSDITQTFLDNIVQNPGTPKPVLDKRATWFINDDKQTAPLASPDPDGKQTGSLDNVNHATRGASGGKYVEALPDTHFGEFKGNVPAGEQPNIKGQNFFPDPKAERPAFLRYNVTFTSTGPYYVRMRGYSTTTEDNSFHVGIIKDGGSKPTYTANTTSLQFCNGKGSWVWSANQRGEESDPNGSCGVPNTIFFDINEGDLNKPIGVVIAMREDGAELDKFMLTNDPDCYIEGANTVKCDGMTVPPPPSGNSAPQFTTSPKTTATPDVAYSYDANATDSDQDTVTFSMVSGPASMTVDSTTGVVDWTPTSSDIGQVDVTISASDGTDTTNQSFTINVSLDSQVIPYPQDGAGFVWFEAEKFHQNVSRSDKTWVTIDDGNASGGSSIQALPNTLTDYINSNYVNTSPRVDYQVIFNETGTYYLWIKGAAENAEDDSLHAGIDNTEVATATRIAPFFPEYSWVNSTKEGTRVTIDVNTTGQHTLNLWMREDGMIVDQVLLTKNADYDPNTDALPEPPVDNPTPNPLPAVDSSGLGGIVLSVGNSTDKALQVVNPIDGLTYTFTAVFASSGDVDATVAMALIDNSTNTLTVTAKAEGTDILRITANDGTNDSEVLEVPVTVSGNINDANNDGISDEQAESLGLDPMKSDGDTDGDGKLDAEEVGDLSSPKDSDQDGIIDALETNNVDDSSLTFVVPANTATKIGLEILSGKTINVTTRDPAKQNEGNTIFTDGLNGGSGLPLWSEADIVAAGMAPEDAAFDYPFGIVDFKVMDTAVATITIDLPDDLVIPENAVLRKLTLQGTWMDYNTQAHPVTIDRSNNTITFMITDNEGLFDLDTATDVIHDPVGLAVPNGTVIEPPNTNTGNGGGGGGGGCTLSKHERNVDPTLPLLLALSLIYLGRRAGRKH